MVGSGRAQGDHQLCVSASTDGADLSAEYIVDNDLAPVMSTSFGECEAVLGHAENTFYNKKHLLQQSVGTGCGRRDHCRCRQRRLRRCRSRQSRL